MKSSSDPEINAIHAAYQRATGVTLALLPSFERWWFDALQSRMSPADVELVIHARIIAIEKGDRHPPCLYLRNICGSEEAIGDVMNEAAAIRAKQRKPKFSKGKAEVLRATGRPVEPETQGVRHISEVIAAMRDAVNK